MNPFFKELSHQTSEIPTESHDTTPRIVQMPLRELIDSLALLDALKSEEERWVEVVNFPEYGTFSVEFLLKGKEPDSVSEPEQEEAVWRYQVWQGLPD